MIYILILVVTTIISFIIISFILNKQQTPCMSFKASNDLVGLPIITFYSNKQKLHFLLDTGADRSAFSKDALDKVEHTICDTKGNVCTMADASGHVINVDIAYLKFYYENKVFEGYFRLMDMQPISNSIDLKVKGKRVEIVGVIGDDFLTKYKYILDFSKMIAYSKK